jgi:hypothetical protein
MMNVEREIENITLKQVSIKDSFSDTVRSPSFDWTIIVKDTEDASYEERFKIGDFKTYSSFVDYMKTLDLFDFDINSWKNVLKCWNEVTLNIRQNLEFVKDITRVRKFPKEIAFFPKKDDIGSAFKNYEVVYNDSSYVLQAELGFEYYSIEDIIWYYLKNFGLNTSETIKSNAELYNWTIEDNLGIKPYVINYSNGDMAYSYNKKKYIVRKNALFQRFTSPLYINESADVFLGYLIFPSYDTYQTIDGVLQFKIKDVNEFKRFITKSRMLRKVD